MADATYMLFTVGPDVSGNIGHVRRTFTEYPNIRPHMIAVDWETRFTTALALFRYFVNIYREDQTEGNTRMDCYLLYCDVTIHLFNQDGQLLHKRAVYLEDLIL